MAIYSILSQDAKIVTFIWLIFQVIIPTVFCQMLTSTVSNGDILCPGKTKLFICETRGSGGIAWTSDEYIGTNAELEFNTDDPVNEIRTSNINSNVVATFLRNDFDGSLPVLNSQLSITVSSTIRSHSVTCIYTSDRSRVDTITFQPLALPNEPAEMISNQTMDMSDNCVLHLSWSSPPNIAEEDISHYMIHLNGSNVVNKTHTPNSIWQLFAFPVCTCVSYNVSIQTVNRCDRVGPSTDDQSVVPLALPVITCPADHEPKSLTTITATTSTTTTAVVNTTNNSPCPLDPPNDNSSLIAGIIILAVLLLFVAILLILVLAIVCYICQHPCVAKCTVRTEVTAEVMEKNDKKAVEMINNVRTSATEVYNEIKY